MKPGFYRPIQQRGLAFLVLLLLALAILGGMIWRNLDRFEAVLSYVNYSHRIQNVSVGLQQSLIEYLTQAVPYSHPEALTKTLGKMDELMADTRYLSTATRTSLETVITLLSGVGELDKIEKNTRLITALKVMSQTLDKEALKREKLLADISNDTKTEMYMALITLAVILVVAVLFVLRKILHPLNDLKRLLQRLTEENFTPITTDHLDPLLLPVFNSYNDMVRHLAELEEAKRLHAQSLQHEVRVATQALLEQQYSLARAERLAAIGEVAAELAHEIRNPLAGIQLAFSNLRREIDDEKQCERMELISSELKRLTRLLNNMLGQSRHSPEAATNFDLTTLIGDLVTLTRYQIAESISLNIETSSPLPVHLPESGIRQALLNLILNAADALDGSTGSISIKAQREEQGLSIDVLDDGPGFSRDILEQGIRPFRTSRPRGNGLGLAMVQRFVKDIGGTLSLANKRSHGACVSIWLPEDCTVER
ncbi:Integral membrane sensor signal transduction histidine kinase [Candidatus Methylobacter favarea]|uniref:histidine kinase n=1 Tax=Candidatus Methylobacter favarea TaxID=2707345 RepID=A0A8S0WZY7_9GAMM|nr:HAMP domain-containing sensor histidine kinase [Candidatus Methylobacter favarea]CAA9890468.1 Integral membrane sensor signal transduction histidine kinase [Candidatus Methylobacter favarea]